MQHQANSSKVQLHVNIDKIEFLQIVGTVGMSLCFTAYHRDL